MSLLDPTLVDSYRRLDACAVSNAIETFDLRLRNEGFMDGSIRALFPGLGPALGHAVTARIKCSTPPPVGHSYHDRTDWWTYILTVPGPRLVVVEDVDEHPGTGALIGHVHAVILDALGCVAYATNGSVRDLPQVGEMGFQFFAPHVSVSHAFVHIVEFGTPVTVGGLQVQSGDLLFGDQHGIVAIPPSIAAKVPAVAQRLLEQERRVVEICQAPDFSLDRLRDSVRQLG